MLKSGTLLSGRYRIQSTLGQGGMGAVYLAEIEALEHKKVAIKEMEMAGHCSKELTQAVHQFKKEASFLANLEHPNLVQVTDFFQAGNKHYLVMAYIEGQTLQEKMVAAGRPFSWTEVRPWAQDLVAVLAYLHNQNPAILFRDLKPSNIMVSNKGRLHLIDFGIARTNSDTDRTSTFLQGTGTRGFSPIEQYGQGQSTDQRSDVYALGATLYYLLTGRVPADAVARVSQEQELLPPTAYAPSLPKGLDELILKSMSLSRRDRHASMAEFNRHLCRVESWQTTEVELPTFESSTARQAPTSITVEVFPSVTIGRSARMQRHWLAGLTTLVASLFCLVALGLKPPAPPPQHSSPPIVVRSSPRPVAAASQATAPSLNKPTPPLQDITEERSKTSQKQGPAEDPAPERVAPQERSKRVLKLTLGGDSYPKAKRPTIQAEEELRSFGPAVAYVEPTGQGAQSRSPEKVSSPPPTSGPESAVQVLTQLPVEPSQESSQTPLSSNVAVQEPAATQSNPATTPATVAANPANTSVPESPAPQPNNNNNNNNNNNPPPTVSTTTLASNPEPPGGSRSQTGPPPPPPGGGNGGGGPRGGGGRR